jgi:hypothetical protein
MTTATLTPIREAEAYDDTVETPADRQAYEKAMKDLKNGVNRSTLDFNKVQIFADFEKFLDE